MLSLKASDVSSAMVSTMRSHCSSAIAGVASRRSSRFGDRVLLVSVRNKPNRNFFKQGRSRKQQRGAKDIEKRMRDSNAEITCRRIKQQWFENIGNDREHRQPNHRADNVEQRCTIAARFAFLLAPKEDMIAVMQVPMFCPMMIGIAAP